MENNSISKKEFILNLLESAMNPFCSDEKLQDILKVLSTSSNFNGLNHLILVSDYLNSKHIFFLTREEAIKQAELAVLEDNPIGNYYLYKLYLEENPQSALEYLKKIIDKRYPRADFYYAMHLNTGDIVEKNVDEALKYFLIAAKYGYEDAYYQILLIYESRYQIDKAVEIYNIAKSKNIDLPGVVL